MGSSDRKIEAIEQITNLNINDRSYIDIRKAYIKIGYLSKFIAKNNTDIISIIIFATVGLHNINGYNDKSVPGNEDSYRFYGLRPASIKLVSGLLSISRETSRRRLINLEKMGFIARVDGKFIVTNWPMWGEIFGYLSGYSISKNIKN